MAFYLMYIFLIFGCDGLSLIITCKGMELRKRCEVWHDFGHTKFSLRLLELVFLDILKHGGGSSHYALSDVETLAELEENL